jgi:RNA methyltransferase, TrmH family
MKVLRSRDNPQVRRWQRLVRDGRARRREARAIIEGPHLVEAYRERQGAPMVLLVSEHGLKRAEVAEIVARSGIAPLILSDSLFCSIADTETPVGIAAEIAIPDAHTDLAGSPACLFLEGIQDMGNVGTILRSAAAFGVLDVVLAKGCADPWAPKALRAAMGAHFSLRLLQTEDLAASMERFDGQIICTTPRGGMALDMLDLRGRIGWIFGAEGEGVSDAIAARTALSARIPMKAGTESLNVAAAVAICLYERSRQLKIGAFRS